MEKLKKFGMKQMWRMQAIGSVYSVFALTIAITLLVYNLISWRFFKLFESWGMDFGTEGDILIMGIIFTTILSVALMFGFIYDRVFKLWKTSNVVAVERNPYTKNLMQPKEVLNWQYLFVPMLRSAGADQEADLMEKWNNKCLKENPELRREVNDVLKWVDDYDLEKPGNVFLPADVKKAVKQAKKG